MEVTELELSFGHSNLRVRVPTSSLLGIFAPQEHLGRADNPGAPASAGRPKRVGSGRPLSPGVQHAGALLRDALAHPVGTPRLRNLARSGQKVVVVTSDLTRPCPSERLLPPVLDELAAASVPDEDVSIVTALGLHRPMTASELETAVGAGVYRRVRVMNHDPSDVVRLGITSAGTPVELFRPVVEADLRVCLGNLELHYFAGFSGGAKAILPGCASEVTVNANHAMMVRPEASTGRLEGNPLRADIEEGVAMLGVDFVLNVVVDGQHRIVEAIAGEVTAAHRQGCELVRQRSTVPIPRRADVVLVSAGGYPKDVNLYQAHKALDNAVHAVRRGGTIILVAECSEGCGNQTFETWIREAGSPDDLLDRIQQEFVLGGHKAAAIASVLKWAEVYLCSAMPPDVVRQCGMVPFDDVSGAVEAAFGGAGPEASVAVLPEGGSVLPVLADNSCTEIKLTSHTVGV